MGCCLDLGLERLFRIVTLSHCLGSIQESGTDRPPCAEACRTVAQLYVLLHRSAFGETKPTVSDEGSQRSARWDLGGNGVLPLERRKFLNVGRALWWGARYRVG